MTRRLLLAALGLCVTSPIVFADDAARPAVRIGAVRTAEEPTIRGQMPDTTPRPLSGGPRIFNGSPVSADAQLPPPSIPPGTPIIYDNFPAGGPVAGGVTMGPATPTPQYPGGAGTPMPQYPGAGMPMPQTDAPLFAPGSPYLLHSPNSTTNKFWLSAEYLYWWTSAPTLPTLVTTGPAASNGILGQPGTQILLGDGGFENGESSGGRFGLGYWFGNNQCRGIDVNYFFLSNSSQSFNASSAQFPVLARPFTNLNQNIPFSQLVASPNLSTGSVAVNLESSLWGIDTNWRRKLCCGTPCFRLEGLLGFRYVNFTEELSIVEQFARTPNSPPSIGVPNAVSGTVSDSFGTKNEFYGGQLGLNSELRRGRWFLNTFGKVAIGEMQQTVTVNGSQSILLNTGATSTANGGLLALPGANIGTWTQNKFACIPEFGVNLGYHFTPHFRMFVGYNFLYLNNVLRPADQIDTGLDVTRIPNFPVAGAVPLNTVRPAVPFKDSNVTVQGINFGLQFSW